MELKLAAEWKARLELFAKGNKLCAKANKLYDEANKLYAKGNKLDTEGDRLRAEDYQLCTKGYRIWFDAVTATYGNIKIKWVGSNCILENGDEYIA
jgi:hypothetical protein